MERLTASKFGLALQCTYPWTSGLFWDTSSGYSAKLGRAFHRYAELLGVCDVRQLSLDHKLTPALDRRLRAMIEHWKAWKETLPATYLENSHRELKLQIDPEFGDAAILAQPGERNYSGAWPNAVTMTADVVMGDTCRDYKTGNWVEHPSTNPQMRLLSLAVSKVLNTDSIFSNVDRFQEDGYVNLYADHGRITLQQTEHELRTVHLKITKGDPGEATPSRNACKYCPIKKECTYRYREPTDEQHASEGTPALPDTEEAWALQALSKASE